MINGVDSEPYLNFTLYSKRCNCSLDSCGHEEYSAELLPYLNVTDVKELDADK